MKEDLYYLSIARRSVFLRAREISPVEIVKTSLSRINKLNQKLNAIVSVLHDSALEQAGEAEAEIGAGNWRGPLHGIPVGIKDFLTPPT
jgi:aspartyl-tRNA(Asn)/glutamyl-tRNA(Gln) amidotransferase subunit A